MTPSPFKNEAPADFGRPERCDQFERVLKATTETFRKINIRPLGIQEAERAIQAAHQTLPSWSAKSVDERANLLFKTAELIRQRRDELTAMVLLEVHKNWAEADADVCEAIDFLEYYGRESLHIAEQSPQSQPLGVVAVIAPWNFPFAILVGMTAAAVVTGNTVVMKPAEQAPVIASVFYDLLREAKLPEGVVNFLPGTGELVGAHLVKSPEVALVAFTGSKEVGQQIASVKKRTIAEMGGKNALIVDRDTDPDQAAEAAMLSAFGYQGQKCSACSRVIVLEPNYQEFKNRFLEKTAGLRIGDPRDPGNFVGPVIDRSAYEKISGYIQLGQKEATLAYQGKAPKGENYVAPTVFSEVVPTARIAREEIFGPVVCLIPAQDLDEALKIANGVPYDLTGGIFSKNRGVIDRIKREFNVGNLYINRKISGALVACQPFGGYRLSSLGFKAGGPEYLYQFLNVAQPPLPPPHRRLPSAPFQASDKNELVYTQEGNRWLSKTICERTYDYSLNNASPWWVLWRTSL